MPRGIPGSAVTHCKECKEEITFFNVSYNKGYIRSYCKFCHAKQTKEWQQNNPEKNAKRARNAKLRRAYGMSKEEYDHLFHAQLGGCAICKKPCSTGRILSVDHNHETGEVRGLLCHSCNVAIGFLKEDEELVWNILEYLKRTTWSKKSA